MSNNEPALIGDVVTEFTLPSGGTVTLRDPRELRAKDRTRVLRRIEMEDVKHLLAVANDMAEGTAMMLVDRWEIPYLPNAPLPRDEPSIIGELTLEDHAELLDKVRPATDLLFPSNTGPGSGPTRPASA